MMAMPVCLGLYFCLWGTLADFGGLPLEPKHRAKNVIGKLGAPCVLALLCLCLSPATGLAQDSAGNTSTAKKTVATKVATSKEHAKAAPSGAKASSTASTKAHPASHPSAIKHSKSSTSLGTHSGKARYASSRTSSKRKPRGQQKIDSERAEAIQEALIREHYMSGEPTGTWNQTSEDAMRRYQADHGWQSKQVPDSRALISLGLGPSNDHLLNPESAMTSGSTVSHAGAPVSSQSQSPLSHGAEPGARMSTNPAPTADPAHATSPDRDAPAPH
jgi:hypothetical protein